jgi:hypothetical protein
MPIDFTQWCNAGVELLAGHWRPPAVDQAFHGLPFRIGNLNGEAEHAAFLERPILDALCRVTQRRHQAQEQPTENHR